MQTWGDRTKMKRNNWDLSQRDRIIQWVPIIAFILIIAMEFTPYYQNEFSNTNLELSDEEQTITVDYYDDYELIQFIF